MISIMHTIVDVETTGLSPRYGDRVIEIGAVSVEGGEIVSEFGTLLQVDRCIPWEVQQIHGITDAMLIGQPLPEEVYPLFHKFIGKNILVAHNAKFDVAFLRHEYARQGLMLENKTRCTLEISRMRFPHLANHKLETVARHLLGNLPSEGKRHRALDDARLTARVWLALNEGGAYHD